MAASKKNSKRKFRGEVYIDQERCKGCGFCIEFCPTHVLALSGSFNQKGYYPPVIADIEACTGCDLCGMYCPDFAIYGMKIRLDIDQEEVAHGC